MNSFAIVTFFAALAAANAGVLLGHSANVLQGPSSRTTVVGPDGSAISAVAPGGQVITEQHSGVLAHAAPVVAAPLAYAAPSVVAHSAYAAPALAYAAPSVYAHSAYAAPALAYAGHGIVGHHGVDTVIAGPSGTIATSRGLTAHGVYAHGAHGLYL